MVLSINILSVDIKEWLRNGPNNRGVGGGGGQQGGREELFSPCSGGVAGGGLSIRIELAC